MNFLAFSLVPVQSVGRSPIQLNEYGCVCVCVCVGGGGGEHLCGGVGDVWMCVCVGVGRTQEENTRGPAPMRLQNSR